MKKNSMRVKALAIAAGLAAFSAVTQLIHVGYQSPQFGMWIDIVAVTWIITYLLFGVRMATLVSLVGALIITLFAPDTWLGAGMKWVASAPTFLIMALFIKVFKKPLSFYAKPKNLVLPMITAIVVRCLLVIPINYYYAIPIWTGMTPDKAMAAIPWYIIALFNIVQALVDITIAWILVYRFKLKKFAD